MTTFLILLHIFVHNYFLIWFRSINEYKYISLLTAACNDLITKCKSYNLVLVRHLTAAARRRRMRRNCRQKVIYGNQVTIVEYSWWHKKSLIRRVGCGRAPAATIQPTGCCLIGRALTLTQVRRNIWLRGLKCKCIYACI